MKEKVVASPKFGLMNLVNSCMPMVSLCTKSDSTMHKPTCYLVCAGSCEQLTHLSLIIVPISELQHDPLTPKVLRVNEHIQLLLFPLFSPLGSHLNLSRSLGVYQATFANRNNYFQLKEKYGLKDHIGPNQMIRSANKLVMVTTEEVLTS